MSNTPPLGLAQGVVRLDDYTEEWAELYRLEEQRIRAALKSIAVEVQHVGSTAVPGLKAKPILDIAVGIRRLEDALLCQAPLEALGYEYAAWAGIQNDYVFGKGLARTHLVHVVEHDGPLWRNYLTFRDALRANPELVQEYEALKGELSHKFTDNRAAYTAGKSSFIRRVIAAYSRSA